MKRTAFICDHKDCVPPRRLFLLDEPDRPPVCPDGHGRMRRQANMPYAKPEPGKTAEPKVVALPAGGSRTGRRAGARAT